MRYYSIATEKTSKENRNKSFIRQQVPDEQASRYTLTTVNKLNLKSQHKYVKIVWTAKVNTFVQLSLQLNKKTIERLTKGSTNQLVLYVPLIRGVLGGITIKKKIRGKMKNVVINTDTLL